MPGETMLKFQTKRFDFTLLLVALVLSIIGILLIYSAKYHSDNPMEKGIYLKQIVWTFLGMAACFLVFLIPIRFYEVFSYPLYFFSILALILLVIFSAAISFKYKIRLLSFWLECYHLRIWIKSYYISF